MKNIYNSPRGGVNIYIPPYPPGGVDGPEGRQEVRFLGPISVNLDTVLERNLDTVLERILDTVLENHIYV